MYANQPGVYAVSVCSSAGASQFKLTFQASPSAWAAWLADRANEWDHRVSGTFAALALTRALPAAFEGYFFEWLDEHHLRNGFSAACRRNASVTTATNQDSYQDFITGVSCAVIETIARSRGLLPPSGGSGLNCTQPRTVTYKCGSAFPWSGAPKTCSPVMGSNGTSFAACAAVCKA